MRLALLASFTSLSSYAGSASAQLPIFQTERAPEPEPPATTPPPAPSAPPTTESPLPPAPLPPAGATALPAPGAATAPPGALPADSANAPAPAKADVITAHRPAESRADAELDLDEGDDLASAHTRHWYGWQTLIIDGVSLTAIFAGSALHADDDGDNKVVGFGLLGYEFAPGIVHFIHRNTGRGFASFGLRFGLPLAGAILGAAMSSDCDSNLCEAGGAGVGILLGMGGAIAIDAAVFAYDDRRRSAPQKARLVPLVSVTPQQAWVGLGGQL